MTRKKRKRKKHKRLTTRLGPEIVIMFTRKAGRMDNGAKRPRVKRDKRRDVRQALKEY